MAYPPWPDEKSARAFSLRLEGLSFGEIAQAMGITRSAVSGYLTRHGVRVSDDAAAPVVKRIARPERDRLSGTYNFEVPTRRTNDHAKHLKLLLSSLREQHAA